MAQGQKIFLYFLAFFIFDKKVAKIPKGRGLARCKIGPELMGRLIYFLTFFQEIFHLPNGRVKKHIICQSLEVNKLCLCLLKKEISKFSLEKNGIKQNLLSLLLR